MIKWFVNVYFVKIRYFWSRFEIVKNIVIYKKKIYSFYFCVEKKLCCEDVKFDRNNYFYLFLF